MRQKEKYFKNLHNKEENAYQMNSKGLWKHFFKNELRYYNPYILEMFNYSNLLFEENELLKLKGKWHNFFENNNDISIEIGSGSGNFLNKLARNNENINYIGFEIRFKRLVVSAKKADNLNNLCFVRYESLDLQKIFDKGEVTNFYMNFPEPWDNETHKRLFSSKLLENLKVILKENGKIYFKSDHLDYYYQVLNLLENDNSFKVIFKTEDLYSTEKLKDNIETEFESLFIHKLKTSIKYIEAIKVNI